MKTMQTTISQSVPVIAASAPALSACDEEKLVMKSQLSVPAPSATTSTTSAPSSEDREPDAGQEQQAEDEVLRLQGRGRAEHHSYTCLYFRTKRIEIRFMISVSRNSVMPTAKIVLYPMLPVARSPLAVEPTKDASV